MFVVKQVVRGVWWRYAMWINYYKHYATYLWYKIR